MDAQAVLPVAGAFAAGLAVLDLIAWGTTSLIEFLRAMSR